MSVYQDGALVAGTGLGVYGCLGTVENTATATAAHLAGTYFVFGGQFLRATADIAVGGTIAVGTNCVVDNVGAALAALAALAAGKQDATSYTATQINQYLAMVAANPNSAGFAVKNAAIEDATYPGCWYRMTNGVKEWLNPPMVEGVEYRTTERFNNHPVFCQLFSVGASDAYQTGVDCAQATVTHGISNIGVMFPVRGVIVRRWGTYSVPYVAYTASDMQTKPNPPTLEFDMYFNYVSLGITIRSTILSTVISDINGSYLLVKYTKTNV